MRTACIKPFVLAITLSTILAMGCRLDDGPGGSRDGSSGSGTDGPTLQSDVTASQWVRNTTDIQGYAVDVGDGSSIGVTLIDEAGNGLGEMTVRVLTDATDDARDGALQAVLAMDGETALTLRTNGITQTDGYATAIRLETPDGELTRMRAEHGYRSCYDNRQTASDNMAPECATPLSLGGDNYSLPSCGQLRFSLEDSSLATQLRSLTYIQDTPSDQPQSGDLRWRNGDPIQARLSVHDRNGTTESDTVSDWLAASGADAIVGTRAEALLTAAFQDTAWRDVAEERLAEQELPQASRIVNADNAQRCAAAQRTAGPNRGLLTTTTGPRASLCGSSSWLDNLESLIGARATGDPHMVTHSGLAYDFQGAGEFVLARSSADDVEVQARFEPLGSPPPEAGAICGEISITTAVAIRLNDGTRLTFYNKSPSEIRVNGSPVGGTAELAGELPDGVTMETDDNDYTFILATGEAIRIDSFGGNLFNVTMNVPESRRGEFTGLFGTTSGDTRDDFTLADGTQLASAPTNAQLYDEFGASWRITDTDESLFDYRGNATGPGDFNISGFPSSPARLGDLDETTRAEAEAACAEVEGEPQHTWCVLDTACTGEGGFVELYGGMPQITEHMAPAEDPLITFGLLERGVPGSVAADDSLADSDSCRIPAPTQNRVFAERIDHTLNADVTVDVTDEGTYADPSDLGQSQVISQGTEVDVYFVHLPARVAPTQTAAGMRFSGEILGVALTDTTLADSDRFGTDSGRDGVSELAYPGSSAGQRGPELTSNPVTISPDNRALTVDLDTQGGADQLRIFVASP